MAKKNTIFLFEILFLLFIYVNFVKTFEILNVNSQSELNTYPSPISGPYCSFSIVFLINDIDQSGLPTQVLLNDEEAQLLFSNKTSALYSCEITVSNGTYTANLTLPGFSDTASAKYTCNYPNVSQLSVSIIKEITYNEYSYYSAVFKLDGTLLGPLEFSLPQVDYSITRLSNTYQYRISFSVGFVISQTTPNWKVILPMYPEDFSFNITYKNGTSPTILDNEMIDFRLYPDQKEINLMPIYYGQIVKFKLTTPEITTIPYFLFNDINSMGFIVRPISGSLGNIEFISSCISGQTFSLIYQNGQPSFTSGYNLTITPKYQLGPFLSEVYVLPFYDNTTIPMYTVSSNNNDNYDFKVFTILSNLDFDRYVQGFPYGFIEGNNLKYNISISTVTFPDYSTALYLEINQFLRQKSFKITPFSSINYNISNEGIAKEINWVYLGDFKFLIQIKAYTIGKYQIKNIRFRVTPDKSLLNIQPIHLVQGTLFDGVWETVYDGILGGKALKMNSLTINSFCGAYSSYRSDSPLSIKDPNKRFQLPSIEFNEFNFEDLVNITFLYNNIDITNQTVSNIMYFNFTNINNYKDMAIGFSLMDPKTLADNEFDALLNPKHTMDDHFLFAEWVDNRYQVMFDIPANTMVGIANYYLTFSKEIKIFSSELPQSSQLNLISRNIDIYGPIFSKIIKNPPNLPQDTFGWLVTIEDTINGLKNGYITVRGTIDSSLHNFTIEPSKAIRGDKWIGDYEIYIKEHQSQCIQQSYEITDVVLYDTFGNRASYIKFEYSGQNVKYNPFINYINGTIINTVTPDINICNGIIDSSGPVLLSFTINTKGLDVGSLDNRNVTFEFECEDKETGIRDNQFPVVYLTTLNLDFHKCISTNSTPFQIRTKFKCTTTVPIGFGYPTDIALSVYGFINNGGYYSGYSTQSLKDLGFDHSLNTNIYTENQPIITSTGSISNYGGKLMIYGRMLTYENGGSVQVLLKYSDDNDGNYITFIPKIKFNSFILIENIKATNRSFTIKITSSSTSVESNEVTVTPKLFFFNYTGPIEPTNTPTTSQTPSVTPTITPTNTLTNIPSTTPSNTPNNTSIPTVSPIPTNPPQKCQGSPECGGSNQGICKNGGCICYPPFIGLTCTSQIIIVPQPSTNTTTPSTEIPIPSTDNSENDENISKSIFKSLISLVSLRELDFNGEEIKLYNFDKWIFTPLSSSKGLYEISINTDLNTYTNIRATLEWFNKSTTIEFANQLLEMSPSSIKYTIEINKYPFSKSLNTLQLVMSASLISSETNDICSSKEFGNTTNGDDSNYLKIQVDDHSVYGRFIKRAIIDSKVQSIENLLLDSSMKPISNSYSTQSYIGITIPQYSNQVIIDPDFSIIIDQRAASSNSENSICSNNSSSLSKGQIAGIIIGGVAFLSVIIVCMAYYFNKKKRDKMLLRSINRKLEKVG
ncbi:hypothetical protein ACTA71_011467 [Dictyostelium dimigraforme]